jgi:signal transduction histidine kinase
MADQSHDEDPVRERLLSILNHDLRTPLSTILTGVSFLAAHASPGDRRVLERIERSARRMDRMIGEVALLARSRFGGGIRLHARGMDLGEACEQVIAAVERTHPKTPIALERTGDLRGMWDPTRIEQVLTTVVTNVVEHTSLPVVVRAGEEGDHVHVEIDRAMAIEEEDFDPLHERTTELGLFLAGELTRAHGGSMAVRSRDRRAVLAIDLPRDYHL